MVYSYAAQVGDVVNVQLDTKQFGRIAAQTARNIIRQGIRDGERGQMLQEFQSKHQELVTATVERVDPRTGAATLKIGKSEAVLTRNEQVGTDDLHEGDLIKVYVVDVKETERGPRAIISRTHPDLVKRLFETEVPE
ncbi:MAG: NusA N-terminal domain-containing protein, partial [Alloprevotella sp.]|nr:NusA N-terminal domain-containing protein [Alloprevotella sp.]